MRRVTDDGQTGAVRAVYDALADRYVEFAGSELNDATEEAVDRSLVAAFAERATRLGRLPVADLGCGPGRVAATLARLGLDVVGIDISPEMVTRARRAHPELSFEVADLVDLPFAARSLAGAVSWGSIIYTPPGALAPVFDEIARVLTPGGHVLLAFQAGDGEGILSPMAHGSSTALTSYRHDPDDVIARLAAAGLETNTRAVREAMLEAETTPQAFLLAHLVSHDGSA
jgi:SAM-dependent methyltransferase